jgi:hypothetical protein
VGLLANDKNYHDNLLPNLKTYMAGCGFGIAVLDRFAAEFFGQDSVTVWVQCFRDAIAEDDQCISGIELHRFFLERRLLEHPDDESSSIEPA